MRFALRRGGDGSCSKLGAAALAVTAGALVSAFAGSAALADNTVGYIELDGHIKDRGANTMLPFGGGKGHGHLRDLISAFDKAAQDNEMKGVVIRLKDAELSRSNIDELGRAMDRCRKAGKRVMIFADNYGPSEMMLACHTDEVMIQSGGGVMVPGVHMDEIFLGDTFRWIGITPDFVQIGEYKGASEMMANGKPSPAWDKNINGLLDSLYGHMRTTLKDGRKLDDAQLDKALDVAWMASDTDAKKVGLVDTILDLPDMDEHVAKVVGGKFDWDTDILPERDTDKMDMSNPFMMMQTIMQKPSYKPKRDTIAVLHIDGAIIDGDSTSGGLFGGEGSVGCRTIRRAIEDLRSNDKIKGIVVRIDSPGGSAVASEVIWQGLQRLVNGDKTGDDKSPAKPVYASIGSMAASGGYYIAVGTQKIYVNPGSIVGSIGVVGGKMALGGLAEKLHVNTVARSRGPKAGMFGGMQPWTADEKAAVKKKMTETYDLFTSRVTAGRKGIELKETAEGRLFVGQKAVDLKMADSVGGLNEAIGDMASSLKLKDGSFDVMDYPPPKSLPEMLEDMLGSFGAASAPKVGGMFAGIAQPSLIAGAMNDLKAILGPEATRTVGVSLEALMQLRREPVILVSPSVLLFK